ncbi:MULTISPECIES: hypothetical protein [unclassified Phyllobacterium]|uniref:hypothetical protein n=1 Tax=unclassified Phyllobacterium TaxID=2638441 RepID=UPI003012AF7D
MNPNHEGLAILMYDPASHRNRPILGALLDLEPNLKGWSVPGRGAGGSTGDFPGMCSENRIVPRLEPHLTELH